MTETKKTFVLDTNVILHDNRCIDHFEEHDVIIPITVLEELDTFKKGQLEMNYHAREFIRRLRSITSNHIFNGGVSLGEGRGRIMIKLEQVLHADLKNHFPNPAKPDHQILNVAFCYANDNPSRHVVVISKDGNVCLKAQAIGLGAGDYTKDHIKDDLNVGYRWKENCDQGFIERLFSKNDGLEVEEGMFGDVALVPNEYIILRGVEKSALAFFDAQERRLHVLKKKQLYGIMSLNAQQSFAMHALCNADVPLVALVGKAGTGKTLLAIAAALKMRAGYRQIMVARPIVPLSNKDQGYLPGTIDEKIRPFMQPIFDNLGVIKHQFPEASENFQKIQKLLDEKKLIIEPLAFIRGRSLVRKYMIIDEAQNLTPHEVKTIITRAGIGTKVVFTGDPDQIDHPYLDKRSNGLSFLVAKMHGQDLFAHITLNKGERSPLSELASNIL
jgi:PhoH-like ATPase